MAWRKFLGTKGVTKLKSGLLAHCAWCSPARNSPTFRRLPPLESIGRGVNLRVEADPIWKRHYFDISLAVSFLALDVGGQYDRLRGFGFTLDFYAPGH